MAYLSGRCSSDGLPFGTYTQDDVDALRAIAEEPGVVDLFLSYPFFIIIRRDSNFCTDTWVIQMLRYNSASSCCNIMKFVCEYFPY